MKKDASFLSRTKSMELAVRHGLTLALIHSACAFKPRKCPKELLQKRQLSLPTSLSDTSRAMTSSLSSSDLIADTNRSQTYRRFLETLLLLPFAYQISLESGKSCNAREDYPFASTCRHRRQSSVRPDLCAKLSIHYLQLLHTHLI